uniref:Uncharacterized protein n=1 Tax=Globodera rostochiensis TaxID=31243 RepID=A0A914I042_GLORO
MKSSTNNKQFVRIIRRTVNHLSKRKQKSPTFAIPVSPKKRPPQLGNMLGDSIEYEDEPKYELIEEVLQSILIEYNLNGLNYDWEDNRRQNPWQQPQHNNDLVSIYDGPMIFD